MKKYNLTILASYSKYDAEVYAKRFSTTTNSSNSQGFYAFYDDSELVACYPIDRTIITSIESISE